MILKSVSPIRIAYNHLRLFGVLNYEDRPWSLILAVYNVIMMNICLFGSCIFIYLNMGNFRESTKSLSVLLTSIHIYGKVINGFMNQRNIKILLNRLEEFRTEILKVEENKIFVSRADSFLIKFIVGYNTFLMSYPFLVTISCFLKDYQTDFKDPHQAVEVWIPWNRNSLWTYLAGMAYEILRTITMVGYLGSFTTLQFTFTFQTSAFLQALQYQIETSGPKNKIIYKQHANIIQLIQKYNELFSGQMCLEIMLSSLQPCGYGYALIKALKSNDPEAVDIFFSTCATIMTTFVVCFCGEEIVKQVEKLYKSTYQNLWYEEKPVIRKNLLTMMIVAGNPPALNYRKWIYFNYIAFATVIQGIYSYMSMLSNF